MDNEFYVAAKILKRSLREDTLDPILDKNAASHSSGEGYYESQSLERVISTLFNARQKRLDEWAKQFKLEDQKEEKILAHLKLSQSPDADALKSSLERIDGLIEDAKILGQKLANNHLPQVVYTYIPQSDNTSSESRLGFKDTYETNIHLFFEPIQTDLLFATQYKRYIHIENLKNSEAHKKHKLEAVPNKLLLNKIQQVVNQTQTGYYIWGSIKKNNIKVIFATNEEARFSAFYADDIRSAVINHCANDTLDKSADSVIHEGRHGWQYRNFPELFDPKNTIIDQFVANKLVELDAYAAAKTASDERRRGTPFQEISKRSNKDIYKEVLRRICKRSNPDKPISSDASQLLFLKNIYDVMTRVPWAAYEESFILGNTEVFQGEDFPEQIARSRFLQPSFLKRFCVAANGASYLLSDPQPFFRVLIKEISKLHHPYFDTVKEPLRRTIQKESQPSIKAFNRG